MGAGQHQGGPAVVGDVFQGVHRAHHHRRPRVVDPRRAHVAVPGPAVELAARRRDVVGVVDERDVGPQDLADEREDARVHQQIEEDRVVLEDRLDFEELRDAAAGQARIGAEALLGRVAGAAQGRNLPLRQGVLDHEVAAAFEEKALFVGEKALHGASGSAFSRP